jgi:hypothetical protein
VILHAHSLPPREEEIGQDTAKRAPKEWRTYFIPDVLANELAWLGMTTFILVLMCTWFYHAPLENHADPQVTPLHTTAPWYFLWLQGMLKLGDKVMMGIVLPTIIFGGMFALPYIDLGPSRRYANRRVALTVGALTLFLFCILQYMGTPFYGVNTAKDIEVAQELIPQEGVGPVRAVPFDEWVANVNASGNEIIWTADLDLLKKQNSDLLKAKQPTNDTQYDIILSEKNAIVIEKDNIEELEEKYAEDYPELWHVIEEFHYLLFDRYDDELPNAKGYLSISLQQPNLVRVYLLTTWDTTQLEEDGTTMFDDDGKAVLAVEPGDGSTIRGISGKTVFINRESEWHQH